MAAAEPLAVDLTGPWRRADPVLWRATLDGVVVLPSHGQDAVALRGPAAGIWELLAQPMTEAALVSALARRYAIDEERVAGDVVCALDRLLELGALCRV